MKKLYFLVLIAFLIALPLNAQLHPAGTVIWSNSISDQNQWEISNQLSNGIAEIKSDVSAIDTAWYSFSDSDGFLYFCSNGTQGTTGEQEIIFSLIDSIPLPDQGKEHLALSFEQLYTKKLSKTFFEYSYDNKNWNSIEINKLVLDTKTIRRFIPIKLSINKEKTKLFIRFKYIGTAYNSIDAKWAIDDVKLIQLPIFNIVSDSDPVICKGDSVILESKIENPPSGDSINLSWSVEKTNQNIVVKTEETIILSADISLPGSNNYSLLNSINLKDSIQIKVKTPFEDEEIFLATVDPYTNKYLIAWKKTRDKGTISYNIYKGPTNNEELIKSVSFDDIPVFVDENSEPGLKTTRYKITTVDTCGNESFYSETHSPIMLKTIRDRYDYIKLVWSKYEGFDFDYYYIYKGDTPFSLTLQDSVSSADLYREYYILDNYTDTNYYRIEIDRGESYTPPINKVNSGPFSRSISNLEDNRVQYDPATLISDKRINFKVYPNPVKDFINVSFFIPHQSNVSIQIIDVTGNLQSAQINTFSEGSYSSSISVENLPKGVYFIYCKWNDNTIIEKFIKY